jgi:hypothetical protein
MVSRSRHAFRLAILLGTALALTGCDTIRNASGGGKEPPDEFAVVTKAPLIIPPDYNLRPPQPGAAPTNQLEPTQSAEQALFSADSPTGAATITGNYSDGEKELLASAGAQNADPNIRQDLVADDTAQQTADDSFTDQVLFWNGPSTPPDQSVNADAAAAQVNAQQAAGQTAAATPAPAAPSASDTNVTDSATIDKDNKHQTPDNNTDNNQSSGGWFDWF